MASGIGAWTVWGGERRVLSKTNTEAEALSLSRRVPKLALPPVRHAASGIPVHCSSRRTPADTPPLAEKTRKKEGSTKPFAV